MLTGLLYIPRWIGVRGSSLYSMEDGKAVTTGEDVFVFEAGCNWERFDPEAVTVIVAVAVVVAVA